jgi:hypothetical protein
MHSHAQQFQFKELVAMSKSQSVFEQNMARKANFPKSKYDNEFVQYRKENNKVLYWELLKNFKDDSSVVNITKIFSRGLEYIENYSIDEEYGTTIYQWNDTKVFTEKGELLMSHQYRNSRQLTIKYQNRSEYLKILEQVNVNAKFIKSEESESYFDEKQLLLIYKYLDVEIVVKSPRYSEIGGDITFRVLAK